MLDSPFQTTRHIGSKADDHPADTGSPCPVCDLKANFGAILDTITDGVIVIDAAGIIQLLNPAVESIFGYRHEDLLGQDVKWLMPSPDRERHARYLENHRRTGIRKIIGIGREVTGQRRDGALFPMYLSVGELQLGDQRLYVGIVRDLTQQKQAREALEESEARFRHVADMVGEWLWEQDAAGRYSYSSGAVEEILGYRPEEIIGKHYFDLMTPEDREYWLQTLPPADQLTTPFRKLTNRYRHRHGHAVYTESSGEPILDARGQIRKWRGMDQDITARKRFEDALQLRDRALEAANVGIVIADAGQPDFPTLYANSALSRITGYAREELLGRDLRVLLDTKGNEAAGEGIRGAMQEGVAGEWELRHYRKDGTAFWTELLLSPVHDESGGLTHYIGILADISERRRAEEEHRELEFAKRIQLSLLPKAPLWLPGIEAAGVCVPASQVGGDYFDIFHCGSHVDLVIADVSGHSVGAALMMVELRSTLLAEIRRSRIRPFGTSGLLSTLNYLLYRDLSEADLFVTMFYLRYEPYSRQLYYANAGHHRALLLRRGAEACTELDAEGLILGVRNEAEFEERALMLQPDDLLLLYTDGLVEAQDESGEFYGRARVCRSFHTHRDHRPETLLQRLLDDLRAFRGKRELQDDVTLVAIRIS